MSGGGHGTSRRATWRPIPAARLVLAGACAGSVFGLVFGLTSLDRPAANALVFYVLGALAGAVLAAVVVLLARAGRRRHGTGRDGTDRYGTGG